MKKALLITFFILALFDVKAVSLKESFKFNMACQDYGISPLTVTQAMLSMQSQMEAGNFSQANYEANILVPIFDTHKDLRNYEPYGYFIYNYGFILLNLGRVPEAIDYFRKSEVFWKEKKGENDEMYVNSLLWLADAYEERGDTFAAKHYLEEAEKHNVSNKAVKEKYCLTKAKILKSRGRGREALEVAKEVKNPSDNVKAFIRNLQRSLGERQEALSQMKKEYEKIKKIKDTDLPFLNQYAVMLSDDKETLPEAIRIGTEIVDFCRERNLVNSSIYISYLQNLGVYHTLAGNYSEGQKYLEKAHGLLKFYHPDNARMFLALLPELQNVNYLKGDYLKAAEIGRDNLFIEKQVLSLNMLRPEEQRKSYWQSTGNWYVSDFPKVSINVCDSALWAETYDALLAGKGMVNYSDKIFAEIATANGGEMKQFYDEYIDLNNRIKEETNFDAYISLVDQRDKVFDKFAALCKNAPEFKSRFSFFWQDVAKNLKPGESGVEFFSYNNSDDKSHYGAAIIQDSKATPVVTYLCSEDELAELNSRQPDPKMWDLVWAPLEKYIGNSEKVYFAPAGQLYTMPIEYASNDRSQQYVRLTSTRMLLDRDILEDKAEDMVLYGGLAYRMTPSSMESEHSKYPKRRDVDIPYTRQGAETTIPPLENTLYEVENIAELVSASLPSSPKLYTGREGVEESFKALSGDSPSILHVATHGFFFDEEPEILLTSRETGTSLDKSMRMTGLLLAGANKAFAEGEPPEGVDDGILTALEISELDLGNTNLAVLSACETGLGSISGDGVAGLQSAFKQAGVDQLLLSLWKVDDEATSELMKEFYRQWIVEKKSKHEALSNAREHIRKNALHPEWNSPDYWAAFILLDDLE